MRELSRLYALTQQQIHFVIEGQRLMRHRQALWDHSTVSNLPL